MSDQKSWMDEMDRRMADIAAARDERASESMETEDDEPGLLTSDDEVRKAVRLLRQANPTDAFLLVSYGRLPDDGEDLESFMRTEFAAKAAESSTQHTTDDADFVESMVRLHKKCFKQNMAFAMADIRSAKISAVLATDPRLTSAIIKTLP